MNLKVLLLKNNQIFKISLPKSAFKLLSELHFLDLGDNVISHINADTFEGMQSLQFLILAGNPISDLSHNSFADISTLTHLSLKAVNITPMSFLAFKVLHKLESLDLSNNVIKFLNMQRKILSNMSNIRELNIRNSSLDFDKSVSDVPLVYSMDYIGSDDWRFCCIAEHLKVCDVPQTITQNCYSMIGSFNIKVAVCVISTVGLGSNILVLVYHTSFFRQYKQVQHLILLNLGLSDSLASLYFLSIGIADQVMRENYVLFERVWRYSPLCLSLAYIQNFSMESSLVGLLQISALHTWVHCKEEET